ncbi:unnamed protein product [Ceratitis capitata]|uniref:(Mediterranean fruit fly) hypothetical protein n=1 Tax=Ceratitis capitata TaxID=7213 RepID=A0A811U5X0_CERCA|nr:unnamed protein product [Ceratitis capitata]
MNCLKAAAQTRKYNKLTNFIVDDDNKDKRVHVAATDDANTGCFHLTFVVHIFLLGLIEHSPLRHIYVPVNLGVIKLQTQDIIFHIILKIIVHKSILFKHLHCLSGLSL